MNARCQHEAERASDENPFRSLIYFIFCLANTQFKNCVKKNENFNSFSKEKKKVEKVEIFDFLLAHKKKFKSSSGR